MVNILLAPGFEEAEALVPADPLRRAGVPVSLAGVGGGTITGAHGIPVTADTAVEQVILHSGDMLVLPGGPGVAALEGSDTVLSLIRQAAQEEALWLAAICAAPTLLARMGRPSGGVLPRHGARSDRQRRHAPDGSLHRGGRQVHHRPGSRLRL